MAKAQLLAQQEHNARELQNIAGTISGTQNLDSVSFANRSLGNLLFTYQNAGYDLIYSDELVQKNLIIKFSPTIGDPIQRLKRLLVHYQLGLINNGANSWLIVKQRPDWQLHITLTDAITQQAINTAAITIDGFPIAFTPPAPVPIYSGIMQQIHINVGGYQPHVQPINGLPTILNIHLQPIDSVAIEETLVTASFYQWQKKAIGSKSTLHNLDIKYTPTRGNDPVQAIANLPGVAGSGVSAKPNIRGGASDELLILFDGIELYDPFHLKDFQGLLSGINSHIVDQIAVYTGGYPARYGSKMSGVMDIKPISPTTDDAYSNTLEFNPIYSAVTLSHLLDNQEDYLLFAARRGNLETTLSAINPELGAPRFNDTFAKYHWTYNQSSFDLGFFSLRDDVELHSMDNSEGETAKSIYNSEYIWLRGERQFQHYQHQWQVIHSYNKNERVGFINEPNNPDESTGSLSDMRRFQSLAFKYDGEWPAQHDSSSLAFGGEVKYTKGHYNSRAQALRGELATLLGNERSIDYQLDSTPEGAQLSAYVAYQNTVAEKLQFETGLRLDAQTYTDQLRHQLSPRLAGRYQYNPEVAFKASAGRFYQAASIQDLNPTDGEFDYYSPQKSDHYILGIEYAPNSKLSLSLESYLKRIFNPKTRYENMFNPYALLPELAPDRIKITPDYASAEGLETTVTYTPIPTLKLWGSFSFSEVEDSISGDAIARSWNQVSSLHLGALIFHHDWTLNTQFHWHSGRPTTTLPSTVSDLNTPIDYERNSASLPDYMTFDVRLSREWALNSSQLEIYLDITNATNRNNIGFYEVEISDLNEGYRLDRNPEGLFPILPTLGLYWHF